MNIKNIPLLATIAVFSLAAQVRAENWDFGAATTDWFTPTNWNPDSVPNGTNAGIGTFPLANSPVITSGSAGVNELQVGVSGTGFLTVNGGTLTAANKVFVGLYSNANGTLNQNGGTITGASDFIVGEQNDSKGTYNLTGGTLNVTEEVALATGNAAGNSGNFNQSGGVVNGNRLRIANFTSFRTGTFALSGSAQTTFTGNMEAGLFGSGSSSGAVFLNGSKTGAGTNMSVNGATFGSVGSLLVSIDNDAISNPLNMRRIDSISDISFSAGSFLDLGFSTGVTPTTGSWTIATAVGSINGSPLLNPVDVLAGWSFVIAPNGAAPDTLTISYLAVPEPSTCALLFGSLGTIALLRRRSRRA